jgi:hypothetical protein
MRVMRKCREDLVVWILSFVSYPNRVYLKCLMQRVNAVGFTLSKEVELTRLF